MTEKDVSMISPLEAQAKMNGLFHGAWPQSLIRMMCRSPIRDRLNFAEPWKL